MDRRRFAFGSLVLVAVALAALPAVAAAHFGFVTRSSQINGAHAAKWNLGTETIAGPEANFGGESSAPDVAITPDGTRAYVTENGTSVIPFDVASGTPGPEIEAGIGPTGVAITPDGTRAYVTNRFDDTVSRIDLASGTETATIPVGSMPIGIAITPDGTRAYVTNSNVNTVSKIDLATNAVTAIPVGSRPASVSITPDGTRAYVGNQLSSSISRIDLATDTVVATIPIGGEPAEIAITPDGSRAYVPSNFGSASEVVPINLVTDTPGTTIPTSGFLQDIAITPDGGRAYVPAEFPDLLNPIDLTTNSALPGFNIGDGPEAVAVVPNQPPHATFTSSPAAPTPGQTVNFSANLLDSDTPTAVARYDWDFGDGSSAANAGPNPSHTYAKAGTYQVTVTETDFEGCSLTFVFTGQTAYCNGSSVARTTRTVVVAAVPAGTLPLCGSVKAAASTFIPKRRPGNVLPGVRVQLSTGVPAKMNVTASLLYRQDGKEASAGLGQLSVLVNKWRRVRFTIPPELRQELPIGKPVKVAVRIETIPRDGDPCEATVVNRVLKVHVVKVFPNRVQFERPR